MIKDILEIIDRKFVAKLNTIRRGDEAHEKLSRRQALAWEAGAREALDRTICRESPTTILAQPFKSYRLLQPGEHLEAGDQWRDGSEWKLVKHTIGARLKSFDAEYFRRPIA